MPDGTLRKGTGKMPSDLTATVHSQRSRPQRQWEITLPDGTVRRGRGAIPADLARLLAMNGKRRKRRQAMKGSTSRVMDILSNCGATKNLPPSLHLYSGFRDVSLTVVTSNSPVGVTVSLPAHEGINEVMFMYDGQYLTGNANGYVGRKPLSGQIKSAPSPVMLGQCLFRNRNYFVGEIDMEQQKIKKNHDDNNNINNDDDDDSNTNKDDEDDSSNHDDNNNNDNNKNNDNTNADDKNDDNDNNNKNNCSK
ncbi:hypothetical protein PoB_002632100 [Plakobranchus ocellatus]|uniref:Uncharacterized protein n=1 Tax=Plakobranchus ocellatus TaxID=259542 RepID=A0AAV3ZL17_9GAST|nr:hypothetical protein PoB_002632100 [Plakobranchus ocellatus]